MFLFKLGLVSVSFKGVERIVLRSGFRGMHQLQTHIPEDARKKIEDVFTRLSGNPYDFSQFDGLSKKAEKVLKTFLPNETLRHVLEVNTTGKGFVEITGVPEDSHLPSTPFKVGEAEKQ